MTTARAPTAIIPVFMAIPRLKGSDFPSVVPTRLTGVPDPQTTAVEVNTAFANMVSVETTSNASTT